MQLLRITRREVVPLTGRYWALHGSHAQIFFRAQTKHECLTLNFQNESLVPNLRNERVNEPKKKIVRGSPVGSFLNVLVRLDIPTS